jgi:hypothetical protein
LVFVMRRTSIHLLAMLMCCLCLFFISACQSENTTPDSRILKPSAMPLPSTIPSPTSTMPAPKMLLIASQDIAHDAYSAIYSQMEAMSKKQGWILEQHQQLDPSLLSDETQLVVLMSPEASLAELASTHPDIHFVTIGLPAIQPGHNVTVIGPDGYRADQLAFAAGYLSAVITKDYRIGALIQEESGLGDQLMQPFVNGVIYYCGLCQSAYPPFYDYPITIRIEPGASEADWMNATQQLLAYEVETVFIYANDLYQAVSDQFHEQSVKLIGSHFPSIGIEGQWAATLRFAPEIVLGENWDEIVSGEGRNPLTIPIMLDNVNRGLVSQGRELWVQPILDDLVNGYIDTGITIPSSSLP